MTQNLSNIPKKWNSKEGQIVKYLMMYPEQSFTTEEIIEFTRCSTQDIYNTLKSGYILKSTKNKDKYYYESEKIDDFTPNSNVLPKEGRTLIVENIIDLFKCQNSLLLLIKINQERIGELKNKLRSS